MWAQIMITPEQSLAFHKKNIWSRYLSILLGIWLIAHAYTADVPSGTLIFYSDLISGVLITLFGLISLYHRTNLAGWIVAAVGVWLMASPVFLHAPTLFAYNNAAACGLLAILFGVILPGMPHDALSRGANIPPGWTYNPSSMAQRAPVMFLAFCAWMFSRYMATYQLGYIHEIYDPIWGNEGTLQVITSTLSKSFPVSDAGLAAFLYSFEFILGAKGSEHRWRTMPWIVLGFGILVVPVGLVSILLVMSQPIIVGHWCFWCLMTAVCMLLMIAFTIDEVWASTQHFFRLVKNGKPWIQALFFGGDLPAFNNDEEKEEKHARSMTHGTNFRWNLFLSAVLGAWLMASPSIISLGVFAANSDYITGALVVVFSLISMAQVIRKVRLLNILAGGWLILCPFISLATVTPHHQWSNIAVGILLILLAFPKGTTEDCQDQG